MKKKFSYFSLFLFILLFSLYWNSSNYQCYALSDIEHNPFFSGEISNIKMDLVYILLIALGLIFIACLIYRSQKREAKHVITNAFYPPTGLTSVEMGYLLDGAVDYSDLKSLIFYLADQGFLSLRFAGGHLILRKKMDFCLTEKSYIQSFFHHIFSNGDVVNYDNIDFSVTRPIRKKMINEYKFSKSLATGLSGISLVLLFMSSFLMSYGLVRCGPMNSKDFIYYPIILSISTFILALQLNYILRYRIFGYNLKRLTEHLIVLFITLLVDIFCTIQILINAYNHFPLWVPILYLLLGISSMIFIGSVYSHSREISNLRIQIAGFRDFICSVTPEIIREVIHSDPQYCSRMLPFAITLGIEEEWWRKCNSICEQYIPWYEPSPTSPVFSFDFFEMGSKSDSRLKKNSRMNLKYGYYSTNNYSFHSSCNTREHTEGKRKYW